MLLNGNENTKNTLVDVEDSVLISIDMQDSFLNKYDKAKSQSVVAKAAWLIQVAHYLDVPVVAMGEDLENCGPLTLAIQEALPDNTKIHNKDFFGLTDNPEILAAVEATGRKTAILVGMETDVCVAQSALGLIKNDFRVVVLKDAIATTAVDEEIGLSRMHDAGAVVSSVKALYFEWLRSVTNSVELMQRAPELRSLKQPSCLIL